MTQDDEADELWARILAMSDEEVRAELVRHGIDPDEMVKRTRENIAMTIKEMEAKREGRLINTGDKWDDKTEH